MPQEFVYDDNALTCVFELPCTYGYLEGYEITGTYLNVGPMSSIAACALVALSSYGSSWGVKIVKMSSGSIDCLINTDPIAYSTAEVVSNTEATSCFLRERCLCPPNGPDIVSNMIHGFTVRGLVPKIDYSSHVTSEMLEDKDANKCLEVAYREHGGQTAGYLATRHTVNGQLKYVCHGLHKYGNDFTEQPNDTYPEQAYICLYDRPFSF